MFCSHGVVGGAFFLKNIKALLFCMLLEKQALFVVGHFVVGRDPVGILQQLLQTNQPKIGLRHCRGHLFGAPPP